MERVNGVIELLRLQNCRNTPIGDAQSRGVSGGERKRVNIGNEIVTAPTVILLDEPTSGLDSSTAEIVMSAMSLMAKSTNRTIITTIHQPSSRYNIILFQLLLTSTECLRCLTNYC